MENLSSPTKGRAAPPPQRDDGQEGNRSGNEAGNARGNYPNNSEWNKREWRAEGERSQRFLCNNSSISVESRRNPT